MEVNKEQAERCRDMGATALRNKDYAKAVKMLQKSLKLYPLPGVEALLSQAQSEPSSTSTASSTNGSASRQSTPSQPAAPINTGSDGRSYTDGQVKIVEQVLRAQKGGRGAHYRVLNVPESCDENALKKAYRKLSLKVHPDKNSAPHADEAFKAVGLAYATLSDPQKRTIYDTYGEEDPDNRGGGGGGGGGPAGMYRGRPGQEVSPEEIFNMFFNGGFPQGAGGPGFRVYTSGFGPGGGVHFGGARPRRQQQAAPQQQTVLEQLIRLLPLIIILLSAFTSTFVDDDVQRSGQMPGEGKYFSMTHKPPFIHPMKTQLANVRDIPFYVTDSFQRTYSRNRYQLGRVEQMVESAYEAYLIEECNKQKVYKERLLKGVDKEKDPEEKKRKSRSAQEYSLSRCKELVDLFPKYERQVKMF